MKLNSSSGYRTGRCRGGRKIAFRGGVGDDRVGSRYFVCDFAV